MEFGEEARREPDLRPVHDPQGVPFESDRNRKMAKYNEVLVL
jgi:hypothetical protein